MRKIPPRPKQMPKGTIEAWKEIGRLQPCAGCGKIVLIDKAPGRTVNGEAICEGCCEGK